MEAIAPSQGDADQLPGKLGEPVDRLLVVGAGPAAMVVTAEACVLRELGPAAPQVTVVEPNAVGGNRLPIGGRTDGTSTQDGIEGAIGDDPGGRRIAHTAVPARYGGSRRGPGLPNLSCPSELSDRTPASAPAAPVVSGVSVATSALPERVASH